MTDYDPRNDWVRVRIGDLIVDVDEPRHVGRVRRVDKLIVVEWILSGWLTALKRDQIRFVSRYNMHRRLGAKGGES